MLLNDQSIREFKMLYLKNYGVQLTDEAAFALGTRLVAFIKVVYGRDINRIYIDNQKHKKDN